MLGLALVAAVQATAAGQPRHRPLHGPTVTAKPLSMELGAPTATLPAPGTDRRDAVHQGFHPLLSWVFAAEVPIERGRPVRSVIKWIFEPFLPRSTGFGPVRSPLSPPACSPSRSRSATSQLAAGTELVQHRAVELAPDPGPAPLGEPPVRGRPGRAEARRQLAPRAAGRGHEHDGRQHLPVPIPASAPALGAYRSSRNHPLEQLTQPVRHQTLWAKRPRHVRTVSACRRVSAAIRALEHPPGRVQHDVRTHPGLVLGLWPSAVFFSLCRSEAVRMIGQAMAAGKEGNGQFRPANGKEFQRALGEIDDELTARIHSLRATQGVPAPARRGAARTVAHRDR